MTAEKKPEAITRRDFLKGIAVGAVATAAVSAGVAAVTWPAAPPAPGAVTKTETVTKTTTAAATTVTTTAPATATTVTAPAVTTTVTTTAPLEVVPAYTKVITLNVNGANYKLEVENRVSLLSVLRDRLGFTGAKLGCNRGECGLCTVLMNGKPTLSCMMLAVDAEGKLIQTVESLHDPVTRTLHPIQKAFVEYDGAQCGYCTPASVLTIKALLDRNRSPTAKQVREAIGNVCCRCGNYTAIVDAALAAARTIKGG